MHYINSFILAAVAVLQLCGRDLLTKKCPKLHTKEGRKASAQFANQATWKKREMIAEMC